jgi:DNA-binding transcriptional regulator YiaG
LAIQIKQREKTKAEIKMQNSSNFANGRHIVAARVMAGISQVELAALAGIHRNSLQRWESRGPLQDGWALEKIEAALRLEGVIVQKSPMPCITITNGA